MLKKISETAEALFDGRNRLLIYASYGNISAVNKLLKRGWSPDLNLIQGETPLVIACNHGHVEVVHALLLCNANPNINVADPKRNYYPSFDSPLVATLGGRTLNQDADIVRELLTHGADPNGCCRGDGICPLAFAIAHRRVKSLRLLISAGADISSRVRLYRSQEAVSLFELIDRLPERGVDERTSSKLIQEKNEMRELLRG
jgi:ankyrin repeat protein